MHESEKWQWSRSVVSDSVRPHGLWPTRLLRPWDFPGTSAGVGCHCLLWVIDIMVIWLNLPLPNMLMFNPAISCLTTSYLSWFMDLTLMDRGSWCASVHGVTKSRTWLSNWTELMDLTFQDSMQYCSLQHFMFTTRLIHNWASFQLWPSCFFLFGLLVIGFPFSPVA